MAFPALIPLITKAAPLVTAGISTLGQVLGNRKAARTSTSTPTIPAPYQPLADILRKRAEERLQSSVDLSGYQAGGIQDINQAFSGVQQSIANDLTRRGLASSPTAGTAMTNVELARGGNIAQFLNTLPLLQRQMQGQDIGLAQSVLNPQMGMTSVGAGSAAGAGLDDLSSWLGYLFRQRQLGAGGTT